MSVRIHDPRRLAALAAVLAASVVMSGCAPSMQGDVYQGGAAMRPQTVELGVIESLRAVQIEGTQTGVGAVGGAALGGIAGNAIERDTTKRNGVEVTVRLDSGRMLAIVQQDAGEAFRPGDRVRVLSDGY